MADSKYTMTFEVEEQEYVLLEPGEYKFTVDSIDYGDFNGSAKLPPCGKVTVNIHVDTDNGKAFLNNNFYVCKEAAGLIAAFYKCIGVLKEGQKTFTPDWEATKGKTGIVKTSQREYNGNMYNQVDKFIAPKKETKKQDKKKGFDLDW